MFLMLCVVFAAAGPEIPGVGDVFSMGPTMADGAVPHMLPSAPDAAGRGVLHGQYVFAYAWLVSAVAVAAHHAGRAA